MPKTVTFGITFVVEGEFSLPAHADDDAQAEAENALITQKAKELKAAGWKSATLETCGTIKKRKGRK